MEKKGPIALFVFFLRSGKGKRKIMEGKQRRVSERVCICVRTVDERRDKTTHSQTQTQQHANLLHTHGRAKRARL